MKEFIKWFLLIFLVYCSVSVIVRVGQVGCKSIMSGNTLEVNESGK